jgi:hypothetical protein
MKHKEKLEACLGKQLPWHKSRITFVASFLLSLIQQKTVNLVSISQGFASQAQAESSYRRIQRFFQGFVFRQEAFSLSFWVSTTFLLPFVCVKICLLMLQGKLPPCSSHLNGVSARF